MASCPSWLFWGESVRLDFMHEFLGPPHGLGCFPLTYAGNPVVSLVPNALEIRQGAAQSRGNPFIEQGRSGRLKASIVGIPRIIVKTAVSQLALRSSQALLRLPDTRWLHPYH
jgi:hypothetical protein